GGVLKIARINVPLEPSATGSVTQPSRPAAATRQASRLRIDVGQVQRSGVVSPGGRDRYVSRATKNQLLEVRITGAAGNTVVAQIANSASGRALDDRAKNGVRTWVGRIPEDG